METQGIASLSHVSEIQLSYNPVVKASSRPIITHSKDAYELLLALWDMGKIEFLEQFKVILLNRANRVLGVVDISTGGVAGTVADPKIIFSAALKGNASSIILAHNHPSGNLKPSQADINLTHKLQSGGSLLEVNVLEHIILSSDGYLSFADEGLI